MSERSLNEIAKALAAGPKVTEKLQVLLAEGLARLATETPRQIANANTFFNVFNTLLFIGAALIGACSAAASLPITTASSPKSKPAMYFVFVSACIGWSPVVDRTRARLATTPH